MAQRSKITWLWQILLMMGLTTQPSKVTLAQQSKVLFLVAGQSNAVGQGNADSSMQVRPGTAFEYYYQEDLLRPLADPVGENALGFQRANTGSAWPAFARRYHELTNQTVVLIPAARGGSSNHRGAELSDYGTWDVKGRKQLLEPAIAKLEQAQRHEQRFIDGIIWLQGERDANAIFDQKITPADYEMALTTLIHRFRQVLKREVPVYIVLTGNQAGREPIGNEAVRRGQRQAAEKLSGVHIVYDETLWFAEKGWMKDFVHYNQEALNHLGSTIAEQLVQLKNRN